MELSDHTNIVYEKFGWLAMLIAGRLWNLTKSSISSVMDRNDLEQTAVMALLEMAPDVEEDRRGASTYISLRLHGKLLLVVQRVQRTQYASLDMDYDVEGRRETETTCDVREVVSTLSGREADLCDELCRGGQPSTVCNRLGWTQTKYRRELRNLKKLFR